MKNFKRLPFELKLHIDRYSLDVPSPIGDFLCPDRSVFNKAGQDYLNHKKIVDEVRRDPTDFCNMFLPEKRNGK